MFRDFRKYSWMLWPPLKYRSGPDLSRATEPYIINRALKSYEEIQGRKGRRKRRDGHSINSQTTKRDA